jgi:LysM repeat protein
MRTSRTLSLLSLSAVSAILSSCGGNVGGFGNNPGGTGPFDRNGNYVEAWADNPSKWGRKSSPPAVSDEVPPSIASNEQPPANAVPLSDLPPVKLTSTSTKPTRNSEVEVASRGKSQPKTQAVTTSRSKSKSSEAVASKPKPKSTTTAKSSKSKSSSPSRYVIKKGDSLSLIASRTGTSVSALQRANGIKGTLIQPGKSLVIPR